MSFAVPPDAYARFMGRFSVPLAVEFIELVDPPARAHVLDVGCGPGALTALLVERLGVGAISAIDPSEPFVAAVRERFPDLDVRQSVAERLPYPDAAFDMTLAQLVVHFMADPVAALREMGRVTRPGGLVAASVWDYGNDRAPISLFWRAVRDLEPSSTGEAHLAGTRDGHLVELFAAAGLEAAQGVLTIRTSFASFDEWWEPFTLGVGPAGVYVAGLDAEQRAELRRRCAALLPDVPFELEACAWVATARIP
ncbi:MAG TPA: class I SAM-dependent methyltransferase [Jatrophihabitans sp.]|jgi:SAM-dependent methyltransferase|nr:class I SAM-dependent methyltransferase [Jatrophihabitans sp.]